jgi:hypothetical protein
MFGRKHLNNDKTIVSKWSHYKEEKLRWEVEAVNNQLINGTITREEGRVKEIIGRSQSINIEARAVAEQEALKNLVRKVDVIQKIRTVGYFKNRQKKVY